MGQSTFGATDLGSSWSESGLNTWNAIHDGGSYSPAQPGRLLDLATYFAGWTGGTAAENGIWVFDNASYPLYATTGQFNVPQGGTCSGCQQWNNYSVQGLYWTGGPYPGAFSLGWWRDPGASHVFSHRGGGSYWGQQPGGSMPTSLAGSTYCPIGAGGCNGVLVYATQQDLQIYVFRNGQWRAVFPQVFRSGSWQTVQAYVFRSGTWVPLNRAWQDPTDPFFFGWDTKLEDDTLRILIDGEWHRGLLRLTPDVVSTFGSFDPKRDRVRPQAYRVRCPRLYGWELAAMVDLEERVA